MKIKEKRTYRLKGLELSNLTFKSAQEKKFVKNSVANIAEKIKKLRIEKGFSQEELAEQVSISVSTIKFIEQNQRSPSLPMLFKILYILDRNADVWPT